MTSPFDKFLDSVDSAIERRDCDAALLLLCQFVVRTNDRPATAGRILESRDLDERCRRIGSLLQFDAHEGASGDSEEIYVATELYPTGGHTSLIQDFIKCQPGRKHRILITDIHHRTDRSQVESRFSSGSSTVEFADADLTLGGRAEWLASRLANRPDSRVFLVHHQEDSAAVAAVAASGHPRGHFVHHADYTLSLGHHLPHAKHIDVSDHTFRNCRDVLALPDCVFLPLLPGDGPVRDPDEFSHAPADPEFHTCSCGNGTKFEKPYTWHYPEVVASILETIGGRHYHFGDLSGPFLDEIGSTLSKAGVDPGRFCHFESVPNLREALQARSISVFLGSFPVGGAKTTIEVMASGTPMIGHLHLTEPYLGAQCFLYPEAPLWQHPDRLLEHLGSFSVNKQREHARLAREYCEKHHSGEILQRALAADELETPVDLPPPRPYHPDPFREVIPEMMTGPERSALEAKITKLEEKISQLRTTKERHVARAADAKERLRALEEKLDRVRKSFAWKLASPFLPGIRGKGDKSRDSS